MQLRTDASTTARWAFATAVAVAVIGGTFAIADRVLDQSPPAATITTATRSLADTWTGQRLPLNGPAILLTRGAVTVIIDADQPATIATITTPTTSVDAVFTGASKCGDRIAVTYRLPDDILAAAVAEPLSLHLEADTWRTGTLWVVPDTTPIITTPNPCQ